MSFVKAAPVTVGEVYEVQITENGRWGDGIARIADFPVFVSNAKPGQHLRVRVIHVGVGAAIAETVV